MTMDEDIESAEETEYETKDIFAVTFDDEADPEDMSQPVLELVKFSAEDELHYRENGEWINTTGESIPSTVMGQQIVFISDEDETIVEEMWDEYESTGEVLTMQDIHEYTTLTTL